MSLHQLRESANKRLVRGIWLNLALIALLALSFVALPWTFSAHAGAGPHAPIGFLFTVTTTDDHNDLSCDGDDCTLREAIHAANAIGSPDFIDFSVTGTIQLKSALPNIIDDVEIHGPGPNLLTVRRNTGGNYRIFNVTTTGTVTFFGITISNGSASDFGGGIQNFSTGTVNVTNSTISGNDAFTDGGGIFNQGTVRVTNSTISGNTAFEGGGVFNSGTLDLTNSTISNNEGGGVFNSGTVDLTNSTISNNVARATGGGIRNLSTGTVNVTNSTLSGNSAAAVAGGISNDGTSNVTNSTISGNSAIAGGGVFNNGLFNVKSSIIARNSGTVGEDARGTFASQGFNLIGNADFSAGFTAPTDITGSVAFPRDPKLDPNGLQDNGGPTKTIALLPSSPALDKGTSLGLTGNLTTDQRGTGFLRTFDDPAILNATGGDGTDIGAFELQPPPITAGVSSLINESCPPTNGAIDPGERVTVNLELINTRATSTTNLIATLQTSGGVIAPSAPQIYGVIAGNSSLARDFSFTAEAALISGQTITATLQLQDGASNLGTVSFNFIAGPTPCGSVRLVVTSSLSRANASTVVGAITVQNIGSVAANNVTLTTAKLGAANGTPLPQGLGNLAPAGLASVIVNFTNSTPGAPSTLTVGGTYTGGTFSSTKRVTIP